MARVYIPSDHLLAKWAKGWPSDDLTNPAAVPVAVNWEAVPSYVKLKALVIATDAGLVDLVNGQMWTQSGMVSQATQNGLGYATSAGTNDHAEGPIQYTYSGGDFGGEVSVVHDFLCNAATGSNWRTLLALDGTGYNQGPFIQVNETSGLFEIYYNSTNRVQHTTGAYPTAGESYRYGISHKVGANAVYWGANKTYSSKSPSPNVGASGTGYPRLGSEDVLNRGIGGSHRLFAIFAGALNQVDLERLVDAPYALTKPANDTPFLIGSAAAGGGAYQLDVTAGSLTLTGGSVGLAKGSKLNVTAGALTLSGGTVTLTKQAAYQLDVTAGSLTLTGGTVSLTADRKINITAGALELGGQTVTLTYTPVGAYQLDVTAGALALTGQSITFKRTYALQTTAGSLVLTGQTVTLTHGVPSAYQLDVTAGSLDLAGGTVTLTHSGAVTLADVYSLLEEIHAILGLTSGSPMTVTPTSRTAGSISQTISGDGVTSTTVTRDP